MIRFWFISIFQHPRIKKLDYLMRLDVHSFIKSKWPTDPFLYMKQNQKVYAYHEIAVDADWVTVGLYEFVLDYKKRHHIAEDHFPEISISGRRDWYPMYQNNFEIIDLNWYWNHEGIKNFTKEVDLNYGIYVHRWGDAPLRYTVYNLYAEQSQLWNFIFDYSHYHKERQTPCTLNGYVTACGRRIN